MFAYFWSWLSILGSCQCVKPGDLVRIHTWAWLGDSHGPAMSYHLFLIINCSLIISKCPIGVWQYNKWIGIKMLKGTKEHLICHYIHRKYLKKEKKMFWMGWLKDTFSIHRPQNFHYVFPWSLNCAKRSLRLRYILQSSRGTRAHTHTSRFSFSSRSFILKHADDGALGDTVFIFHQGPQTHMQICLP